MPTLITDDFSFKYTYARKGYLLEHILLLMAFNTHLSFLPFNHHP